MNNTLYGSYSFSPIEGWTFPPLTSNDYMYTPPMEGSALPTNNKSNLNTSTNTSNSLGTGMSWLDLGKLGLGALNTGFNIYGGLKQLSLAKDQLNFAKEAYATNLANSLKSYNNALEDKARSRYAYSTGDASNADAYINEHKL